MRVMDIITVNRALAYDEDRKKFLRRCKKEHFDAEEAFRRLM